MYDTTEQRAQAWETVVRALNLAVPGWAQNPEHMTGVGCAVAAIEKLAGCTKDAARWRTLEHGCQFVSFTPTGGHTRSFDPRSTSHLQAMRGLIDAVLAEQLKQLQAGAADLVKGDLATQRRIHDSAPQWPFRREPMP